MAKKLRWYIKPQAQGAVQTLLVPKVNDDGSTSWETVTDPDEIHQLLIERNTKKLCMSNTSPFAVGPLADAIGPYGDNDIVDTILDGTATLESLGLTPEDVDIELKTLLQCLQRATNADGTPVKDMENGIKLEDYTSLFRHTKESTSSSPSKIHMGHYVASCEHTNISQVHCTFMGYHLSMALPSKGG